ncbi:hypothetical protein [Nitrospira sp. Kam-Ns4a]
MLSLLLGLLFSSSGCVHVIHVRPKPDRVAVEPIPATVTVEVASLAQEGPGSIPRIYYLKWTKQDLREAVEGYLEKRRTFAGRDGAAGDLTLSLKAALRLESRDRYVFIFEIEGTVLKRGTALKSYRGRGRAVGPWARWTTASDEEPITEAVRLALDEIFAAIEADRAVLLEARGS